jgi:AcrR family transcriptional regulator
MPRRIITRRTQQQRREGTIRKLLDATTQILIEEGYAGASVQRIGARAQVSQGGIFRHFATRELLMVAAAEDIAQKLLNRFERAFARRNADEDGLALSLELLRDASRTRLNQAWHELMVAARTSATLRKALSPIARRYCEDIEALGRALLPGLATTLGDGFHAVIGIMLFTFDGEAAHRPLLGDRTREQERFEVLLALARTLALPPVAAIPASFGR